MQQEAANNILALECLENRHLLSADFGAVDFHRDLAKQAPVPAIKTSSPYLVATSNHNVSNSAAKNAGKIAFAPRHD